MYYQNTLRRIRFSDSLQVRGIGGAAPDQRFAPARNIAGYLPDSLGARSGGGALAGDGSARRRPAAMARERQDLVGGTKAAAASGAMTGRSRSTARPGDRGAERLLFTWSFCCRRQRCAALSDAATTLAANAGAALVRLLRERTERSPQRPASCGCERSAQRLAQLRCERAASGAERRSCAPQLAPLRWGEQAIREAVSVLALRPAAPASAAPRGAPHRSRPPLRSGRRITPSRPAVGVGPFARGPESPKKCGKSNSQWKDPLRVQRFLIFG